MIQAGKNFDFHTGRDGVCRWQAGRRRQSNIDGDALRRMNYKFSGQDLRAQTTYIRVCPASTVEAAINYANSERQKGEKIRRLNNREDVLFVLLDRLALVERDLSCAGRKELRGGGRVLVVDASKRASGGGPSVSKLHGD